MQEGKREAPQGERTSQGGEPAAKKVKVLVEERESRNRRMIMKSELLYAKKYTLMDCFITDLKEYMEYYNNERIKLRLNGMSPVLYRKAFEQAHSN